MGFSWKLGRVAGIDLFLHPSFLILPVLGLYAGGVDAVLMITALFGCVVLHELGHALTARVFGIETRHITLYPIGGVASLERMPRAPGAELLITVAGPLVNVGIAAMLGLLLWSGGVFDPSTVELTPLAGFGYDLMYLNLMLAVFNMVPAFPMDGGRVLRSLLSGPLGRLRATEIAAGVGRLIAIAFGVYSLLHGNLMQLFLAAFVYYVAGAELASVRAEGSNHDDSPSDGMWVAPAGHRWINVGNGFWKLVPIPVRSSPWERGPWR